jgi:hypothetical protein
MQPASSLDARWPDLIAAVSTVIDLDATARTSRALIRRRGIRSAAMLLRLALAYGPGGLSLRAAAAWAGASGLADLSDTAVMNRLRQAADWLGEIAGALLRRAAAPAAAGPLPGRRLRIADGSMVARAGGRGSGWRLHATYDPVAGRLTGLELTDDRGAEGFGRTAWRAGDVALGERCYARPPALRQILAAGADVIVRTGWARLRLLDADGAPMAWEPVFESLAPGEVADRTVAVDYSGQGRRSRGKATFPARLIVLRLPPEAAERATAAVRRKHRRHYARHQLLPLTIQSAGYHTVRRLPDAAHLAAADRAGLRGAGRLPAALAGRTRVQTLEKPARPRPPAGEGGGARPQLAARPPHPRPADRGRCPGPSGRSPLRGPGSPDTPVPSRSGASCRRCAMHA